MDLIDELLERDAGTVNSTIIGKLHSFFNVLCVSSRYIYICVCTVMTHQLQTKSVFVYNGSELNQIIGN